MLTLPDRDFAAYIFDCDGTLVDSMPIHFICWTEALKTHEAPFEFTEDDFYHYAGVPEHETMRILNELHQSSVDPLKFLETKTSLFTRHIANIQRVHPVATLAEDAFHKLPIAVASGSEAPIVRACLNNTKLIHLFPDELIITPELVKRGKPSPDMFLLAAERMGVDPADCLVFEDGRSGIEAANAAGMESVFIPRSLR